MRKRYSGRRTIVAALGLLVLGGCQAGASSASAPSVSSESSPTQEPRTLTFELNPKEGYTAHGTVMVETGGGGYTMTVNMSGLTPNSHHLLNLHAGTCAEQDTSAAIPLTTEIGADAAGDATYVKTSSRGWEVPAEGRILTIHGNKPGDEVFVHIACAELTD
jgi:hypothetical protein